MNKQMDTATRERERESNCACASESNPNKQSCSSHQNNTSYSSPSQPLDSQTIKQYLKDPIFRVRYIRHNTLAYISTNLFFIKGINQGAIISFFTRALRKCVSVFGKKIIDYHFKRELFKNKVYIPSISLSVTSRCTLNCKSCNNLMPYFEPHTQHTSTLENMCKYVDKLLEKVDCVQSLSILGGEPLLFKDLPKLVEFLGQKEKIKSFCIITNATIRFNSELLAALSKCKNAYVSISDYSASPNMKVRLYRDEIIKSLKDSGILYIANFTQKGEMWIDPGIYYKRNRSREDNVKNLLSCHQMFCVTMSDDKFFVCPVAKSLAILKGTQDFEGEFIWVNDELNKQRFLDFYKNDFFEACDYCQDLWIEQKRIQPAVQLEGILKMQPEQELAK